MLLYQSLNYERTYGEVSSERAKSCPSSNDDDQLETIHPVNILASLIMLIKKLVPAKVSTRLKIKLNTDVVGDNFAVRV